MKKVKVKRRSTILEYTVWFEPAEEGGYVVTVPTLYGLTTQGETFEEAKRMAKEAIEVYIESLVAHGKIVPVETPSRRRIVKRMRVPMEFTGATPAFV